MLKPRVFGNLGRIRETDGTNDGRGGRLRTYGGARMCGLAGLVRATYRTDEELRHIVAAMGGALGHRGPDDDGVWCDPAAGVALSHRRLAIIDLSSEGHQPMISADGRYVLAFNGEIYNYPDMTLRLQAAGVTLRGHSDTEVLLETIARWSVSSALESANGMFAFALWDRRTNTLTLARDRLGEKPLYYGWVGHEFLFGSELGALKGHPQFSSEIDIASLALLLRHSYVPGPHTIFTGVYKLPAGHTLELQPDSDRAVSPRAFWSLSDVASARHVRVMPDAESQILDQAEELLRDAVRMRMISDVPIGAFLSGGVDSSLIVALMQSVSTKPVRTFTVAVGGQYDESRHSAAVARYLGTDHTEIRLAESEALAHASQVPGMYDEPFADPSALPTALVCAAARRHVKVCLTGDGGDEVFAGYNRYRSADHALTRLGMLPVPLRKSLAGCLSALSPAGWDALGSLIPRRAGVPDIGTKVHKLARILLAPDAHAAYRTLTTNIEPSLVIPGVSEHSTTATDASVWPEGLDPLHLMLFLDQTMTLPDDMLVKVDRASMAVSLECRVPLLDHRVVEMAWRLPTKTKVRNGQGKWLLRQLLNRHVPKQMYDRPKQGFDPPLAEWLRGPLRPWMGDLLSPSRLRRQGFFDPVGVERLIQEHESGRHNHDYGLWTLMVFQSWLEQQKLVAVE